MPRFNFESYPSVIKPIFFLSLYLLFFGLFFSFKYEDCIPGLLDAIMNINIFNQYEVVVKNAPTSFYPYKWFMFLGDPVPVLALTFHVFKLFTGDNFIAYKILLVVIFALNAFSLSFLSSRIFKNSIVQFAIGFLFATNQYLFNLNDNPNILFFAPGFLAIYFLIEDTPKKKIISAALLIGIQILCGFYSFIICGVILVSLLAYTGQLNYFLRNPKLSIPPVILISLFLGLLFIPLAYFKQLYSAVNPMTYELCRDLFSLKVHDIISTHTSSNSYNSAQQTNPYLNQIHAAFPGVIICITAALSLFNFKKNRWLLALFLIGFFLASGPELNFNEKLFPNLLSPHYYFHQLVWVLRIPVRLFLISVFSLCLMAGVFMESVSHKNLKTGTFLAFVIILAQGIEFWCFSNHNKIEASELVPPQQVQETVALCTPPIFFLPAGVYSFEQDKMQYIYMFWVNNLNVNITTGYNGFNPKSNIDMYQDINAYKFDKLLNSPNWNTIVFVDTANTKFLEEAKQYNQFSTELINGLMVIKRK